MWQIFVQPVAQFNGIFCATCGQKMAVEMVLTLGQAFEVAYQLAMLKNGQLEVNSSGEKSARTPHADCSRNADRVWNPPVNAVKPLRSPIAATTTHSSNVTVGLR